MPIIRTQDVYRTNAAQLARLEKLEAVKKAAEEFLDALVRDPGYPARLERELRAAVRAADEETQP